MGCHLGDVFSRRAFFGEFGVDGHVYMVSHAARFESSMKTHFATGGFLADLDWLTADLLDLHFLPTHPTIGEKLSLRGCYVRSCDCFLRSYTSGKSVQGIAAGVASG